MENNFEILKYARKGAYQYWFEAVHRYMDDPTDRTRFNLAKKAWDKFIEYDNSYRSTLEYDPEKIREYEREFSEVISG